MNSMRSSKYSPTARSRSLRRTQTPQEAQLWARLRDRRFLGLKFRRQHPIGPYVVDFVCLEKKVVIEIDGSGHLDSEQKVCDSTRTQFLESLGFIIVRFWNNEVTSNLQGVLEKIRGTLTLPSPQRRGE